MSAPRKPLHKGLLAVGIFAGLGIGVVGGGFVAGILSYTLIKKAEQESRAGWTLVPLIVAARDFAPGEALKADNLMQRSVPEQLATSSMIRPDSAAYVMSQALTVPVQAGEPLRWAFFATEAAEIKHEDTKLFEACQRAFEQQPNRPKPDQTAGEIRERIVGGGAP